MEHVWSHHHNRCTQELTHKLFNQFVAERRQLVTLFLRESHIPQRLWKFREVLLEVVDIRREGPHEVEDVVAAIIPNNAFAFDRRSQIDCLAFRVQHFMRLHLDRGSCSSQQFLILRMGNNRLA